MSVVPLTRGYVLSGHYGESYFLMDIQPVDPTVRADEVLAPLQNASFSSAFEDGFGAGAEIEFYGEPFFEPMQAGINTVVDLKGLYLIQTPFRVHLHSLQFILLS